MANIQGTPPFSSHFDGNQVPTSMGVVGTMGTTDAAGTSQTLPFAVDPATGAAYVNILQGSIDIGTVAEDITVTAGTITRISTIGTLEVGTVVIPTGTVTTGSLSNVAMLNAGTLTTLPQISIGTLPTLNLTTGTITTGSLSNLAMLHAGTLSTGSLSNIAMLNAGTVVQASGTTTLVSTVTTLSNLTNGSVNVLTGTIQNSGTTTGVGVVSALTVGTVGGKAASGAAAIANPVLIGGTDSGGTVYSPLVTTGGLLAANINSGTINVGTVNASLVSSTGTIPLVTTVSNLTNGSINVLTGTVTQVTTVSNLTNGTTRISVGTVGGAAASGVAASGNPNLVAGTDSGGTVYSMLIDIAGNPQTDVITIPQVSVGTIPQISVGTLPTLNLTTGTITTGSLTNIAQIHNAGTLAAGANNIGDVDVATGTVTLLSTVTTLSNLTNGSVNVLTGTIQNSGTTTGVGVVSNLTNGSINVLTGTVTSVTNLAGGTAQISKVPVQIGTAFSTYGTTGAAVWGTIIAASGAGTKQYVSDLDVVVHDGTVDVAVTNIGIGGSTGAGVLARGKFPAGGGIERGFDPVISSGTNGTLSYWLGGAGTVSIDIVYWQGV